jgi:hypothetical protein
MKRLMLVVLGVAALGAAMLFVVRASGRERAAPSATRNRQITIYRSPTCNCCKGYEAYLRGNGFAVEIDELAD